MTDCIVSYRSLAGLSRAALAARWLRVLPDGKRAMVELAPESVATATLAGIALLAQALDAFGLPALAAASLHYPKSGKPVLAEGPDFSISHVEDFAVCAVVRSGRIGVDIERHERVQAQTLRRVASATEFERYRHGVHGPARLWTRKEAVLKAAGATVFEVADVAVNETYADFRGLRWYFSGPEDLGRCAFALAADRPDLSLDLRLAADLS